MDSGPNRRRHEGLENAVFGRLSAPRAHTNPPYKTDLLWETPRARVRPDGARTESGERSNHESGPVLPQGRARSGAEYNTQNAGDNTQQPTQLVINQHGLHGVALLTPCTPRAGCYGGRRTFRSKGPNRSNRPNRSKRTGGGRRSRSRAGRWATAASALRACAARTPSGCSPRLACARAQQY